MHPTLFAREQPNPAGTLIARILRNHVHLLAALARAIKRRDVLVRPEAPRVAAREPEALRPVRRTVKTVVREINPAVTHRIARRRLAIRRDEMHQVAIRRAGVAGLVWRAGLREGQRAGDGAEAVAVKVREVERRRRGGGRLGGHGVA